MKKYIQFIIVITIFLNPVLGQFVPNYQNNYFIEKNKWASYFDSLVTNTPGLTSLRGTGFSSYLKWYYHWERYMTNDGSFENALANKHLINNYLSSNQNILVNPLNLTQQNCLDWKETGPNSYEKILGYFDGEWKNPHITNPNTKRFDGGVGRFDRLFQHPNQPQTLFTIAGDYDQSGAGLFISTNYGQNWKCISDNIKNTEQSFFSFAVLPANSNNNNNDVLFLGSIDNNLYRSTDGGATWVNLKDRYTTNNSYEGVPNNINININNHGIFEIFFIPGPSGPFQYLAFCTKMKIFYSNNYLDNNPTFYSLSLPSIIQQNNMDAVFSFTDAEVISRNNNYFLIVNAAVNYIPDNSTELPNYNDYYNYVYISPISFNANNIELDYSLLNNSPYPISKRGCAIFKLKKMTLLYFLYHIML